MSSKPQASRRFAGTISYDEDVDSNTDNLQKETEPMKTKTQLKAGPIDGTFAGFIKK